MTPLSSRVKKILDADSKSTIVLVLFSFLIIAVQFFRSLPMGMDPYYYLHYLNLPQPGMPPLFFFLAGLPTVLVAFLSLSCVLIMCYIIFNQLGAPSPLLSVLLVGAAPGLTHRMALFEDDIVGIMFGVFAILLYTHGRKFEAVLFCAIGYILAWRGTALFGAMLVLAFIAERFKYWWALLPLAAIQFRPDTMIGENALGVIFIPIVLLGLFFGIRGWKTSPTFVQVWAAVFLTVGILQAKWLWLAAFPLAFMLYDYIKGWDKKKIQGFMIMCVGIGLLFGSWMVYSSVPTSQQFADIQEIKTYTNSVDNSWEFGHWLRYNGIEPTNDNLHPEFEIGKEEWVKEYALHRNETLPGYTLVKNYSWALFLRRN